MLYTLISILGNRSIWISILDNPSIFLHFQLPGTCNFFFWIDDPVDERQPRHVEADTDISEIDNSSNSVLPGPDLKKKMKKLKKKVEIETFHKNVARLIALISWIVTVLVFLYGKSLKG